MIIYPSPEVPIQQPQAPISAAYLFPVMQTRDDYREIFGSEPPAPDMNVRAKHWLDPAYASLQEDDGEEVSYTVLAIDPRTGSYRVDDAGSPVLTTLTIPKYLAGRVNIPTGIANEFPANSTIARFKPYPAPLRRLHPHERLAMTKSFAPVPVIINTRLTTTTAKDLIQQIRNLLDTIEGQL